MHHRKTLFLGVALAVAGGAMLLAQGDVASRDVISQAARLWPVALIAFGVVLLARRTRLAVAATVGAAITAGLVLGGVVVAAPDAVRFDGFCPERTTAPVETRDGTFGASGTIDLDFSCGELDVSTAAGDAWSLDSLGLADETARVVQVGDTVTIETAEDGWRWGHRPTGDAWRLTLPSGPRLDIDAEVNAADADLDLAGARIDELDLRANATDLRLDLSRAFVGSVDLEINAGQAAIVLPSGADLTGRIQVSAGQVRLCAPAGLGLSVTSDVALGDTDFQGLVRVGDTWQTPDLSSMAHRADLTIEATAASVVVNPEGGC